MPGAFDVPQSSVDASRSPPGSRADPRNATPHAASVPRPLTRFIGREREIAALTQHLQADIRLLTLTGPGGVGKTRLAIEVAHCMSPALDQLWFVPLATVREPSLVAPTIMRALGRRQTGKRRLPAEDLRQMINDQPALLVLDNFEQVLDAGPAVIQFLTTCPTLTILLTSRSALRVYGEHVHPVSPLTLPTATTPLEQSEAIRLFTNRAKAVVPDLELTPTTMATIGEICRQVDGLPLAIELATARLPLFSPIELLRRMNTRLAFLTDGAIDQPDRLRSLHASIAWSYDLLTASEQALFARLSVFVGGWTLDAAEAVAGSDMGDARVQEGMASLISKNLVWREITPDGTSRFGMLEIIREFADEQLASRGESTSVRDRHAQWVLALVNGTRTSSSLLDQILAASALEPEHTNIRAALRWLDATEQPGSLAALVNALEHHWEWNKHELEGLDWYDRVLRMEDLAPDTRLQVLCGTAFLAHKILSPQAEAIIADFTTLADAHGTHLQRAHAYLIAGMHAEDTGDYASAATSYPLARDHADRAGERWVALQVSYHLGVVALGQGALDQALAIFDDVRRAATEIADPHIPAWCLVYEALIWCERGSPARAAARLRDHQHTEGSIYRQHEPLLRAVASVVAHKLGDHRRAARLFGSAVQDVPMHLPEKAIVEHAARSARTALGESAFTREWAIGQRMHPGEVHADITRLLQDIQQSEEGTRHQLSPRELDVLRLVALGKTDREIADDLYISHRTAEWHVRNVLGKLGASNRAEAAARATRDGIV